MVEEECLGWRNIPISLIGTQKGEEKTQGCEIAWFQHLEVKCSPEALVQPMISKGSIGPLLGVCYAAVFGTLIIFGIHDHWPGMSIGVFLVLSSVVFVAVFIAGWWVAVRNEQNKRLPTSSKELRRRSKEFYDWLASQGRPRSQR